MLGQGETEGVFQLESSGMKQVLVGLQPQNLEDVIALISLYRPGPMDSIPTYLRNRHEPDKISYKTPQLAHILDAPTAASSTRNRSCRYSVSWPVSRSDRQITSAVP